MRSRWATAYDDWCIAQLAKALDKDDDYELFMKRAGFYKNVWNAEKGFMWPKDADGNWIEPFDPKFGGGQGGRAYFDENNAYTYNWDVLHDFDGLFELMGGREAAEAKLDELFREGLDRSKYEFWSKFPDSTGLVGQFVMGNEPSFSTPYLYNRTGSPWKTQKRLRTLLEAWFNDDHPRHPRRRGRRRHDRLGGVLDDGLLSGDARRAGLRPGQSRVRQGHHSPVKTARHSG